jgi:hypothetical protein
MFEKIAEQQGWNTDSMLAVVMQFITSRGLGEELGGFALQIADTENAAARPRIEQ